MREPPRHPSRPRPCGNDASAPLGLRVMTWLSLAVLLSLAALWGCADAEQRYRTLSLFFDGVPLPEHLRDDAEAAGRPGERSAVARTEPVAYRYHEPYARRNCEGCHDVRRGYELAATPDESCRNCHASHFDIEPGDWVHGPVAMHECSHCHEPHRSGYDGLLTESQPDLCFSCHEPQWFASDPFHAGLDELHCSNCHDPHAAGNPLLLVDARTFERRQQIRRVPVSQHPTFESEDCASCHVREQAHVLVEDVDAVCLSCHGEQVDPAGAPLHQAVVEGKCTTCHTAHQSPRPDLMHPTAEQVCFSCHQPGEIRTPRHPRTTRVDCLTCHTGHRELRPGMLREGVGVLPGRAQRPDRSDVDLARSRP